MKKSLTLIGIISLVAIVFLLWLIYFAPKLSSEDLHWVGNLPYLNALLNTCSAFFIYRGVRHIRKMQNKEKHIQYMMTAFAFSTLFLISYITYHLFHGDTKFLGQGLIRPIYFFILITHILCSIISLPLILATFYLGLTQKFQLHKRFAKVTYPLWLYVSITGVLVVGILKFYPIS
jgi:putative membrane protein